MRRTGVLGGTFDPIHLGHLALADAARRALSLDEVLLLPSRLPPHRSQEPAASPFHRLAMAALAVAGRPGLVASDLELRRDGPSFTADTLRALHAAGHAPLDLFFLTGTDAFAEIATWREYPDVLNLAHFVVCARPGTPPSVVPLQAPEVAQRLVDRFDAAGGTALHGTRGSDGAASARIYLLDAVTPAVSSTEIRAVARAGRPLAGLVPPDVEAYIRRHGLYGAPPEPDAGASASGRQLA
ncbi:MAG: nicotinate-nucleotide adenylyltransferase [Acidobacteriota bacterium]